MAFERLTSSIQDLNESIRGLSHSSAEYYKLNLYKKVIKAVIILVNYLLIGFLGLFVLIFLSIAVAISISDAMENPSFGFYIVAGFYLLLIILLLVFGRDYIKKKILIGSSRKLFNK